MNHRLISLTLVTSLAAACSGAQTGDDVVASPDAAAAPDAAPAIDGEPGAPDAAPAAALILDEVFAAGVTGGTYEEDWVELYNPNPDPVDVSGWHCTDDPTMPMKGVFPADTIVPAMGYLQFAVTDASVGFKLAQGGESFTFFDAADVMVDTVTYGDGEAGTDTNVVSYARIPDLTGAFQTTATVTPGAANPATP